MAYRILNGESTEDAIRTIAHEQLENAIQEINNPSLDQHATVHQIRKRFKKIRGLVRLVRPEFGKAYRQENDAYRDAARPFSGIRDAVARIETYDALMDHYQEEVDRSSFASVRRNLTYQRKAMASSEVNVVQLLEECIQALQRGQARVESWELGADEYQSVQGGLRKTYARARDAMQGAYDKTSSEKFHQWRKRAKYHAYHVRLLRELWPSVMKARRDEANRLSDLLGDEHDLSVFRKRIMKSPDEFGTPKTIQALLGLLAQRQVELRLEARLLGERLFAEKPKHFVHRLGRYWKAMRQGEHAPPKLEYVPSLLAV